MKIFKLLDIIVSIALMITFCLISIFKSNAIFITGYFVVGGWQIISMLVHQWNGWLCRKGTVRYFYHVLVLCILSIAILGLLVQELLVLLMYIMLFAAPFLAIFYTMICYNELTKKMQRPLALLK